MMCEPRDSVVFCVSHINRYTIARIKRVAIENEEVFLMESSKSRSHFLCVKLSDPNFTLKNFENR